MKITLNVRNLWKEWKNYRAYKATLKPILTGRAKALRTKCEPVSTLVEGMLIAGHLEDAARLINNAAVKNRKYRLCAGLAANQLGMDARVFIVAKSGGGFRRYVNPVIINKSDVMIARHETCFSNKNDYDILRARWVLVKADGMLAPKKLTGIEAWAFQHEFDHLEGIIHG
jgi:peptide deformylase